MIFFQYQIEIIFADFYINKRRIIYKLSELEVVRLLSQSTQLIHARLDTIYLED
jgi:hypothetical protein